MALKGRTQGFGVKPQFAARAKPERFAQRPSGVRTPIQLSRICLIVRDRVIGLNFQTEDLWRQARPRTAPRRTPPPVALGGHQRDARHRILLGVEHVERGALADARFSRAVERDLRRCDLRPGGLDLRLAAELSPGLTTFERTGRARCRVDAAVPASPGLPDGAYSARPGRSAPSVPPIEAVRACSDCRLVVEPKFCSRSRNVSVG